MEIIFNNYSSPKRDENTQSSEPVKPSAEKKSVTVSFKKTVFEYQFEMSNLKLISLISKTRKV